jgi:hypothetical protein
MVLVHREQEFDMTFKQRRKAAIRRHRARSEAEIDAMYEAIRAAGKKTEAPIEPDSVRQETAYGTTTRLSFQIKVF